MNMAWKALGIALFAIVSPFLLDIVIVVLGCFGLAFGKTLLAIDQIHQYYFNFTDISNHTIINGLEDCNALGNFEWTAMLFHDYAFKCSGVLIHPNYVLTAAHCFRDERRNLTNLNDIEIKFGNAAKPQSLQLKSPQFYVPNVVPIPKGKENENFILGDLQIIKLDGTLNIDPVLLPSNINDFYYIENEELVFVTLRDEHKQRLLEPLGDNYRRHEKCTKIHIRTGLECLIEIQKKAVKPEALHKDQVRYFQELTLTPKILESSRVPMLCTFDYQSIEVNLFKCLFIGSLVDNLIIAGRKWIPVGDKIVFWKMGCGRNNIRRAFY